MKYNMKQIMSKAWEIFRKGKTSFAEALHRAWLVAKQFSENAEIINKAKSEANITVETRTWHGWKTVGREVNHESKCLFQCTVKDGAKGDNATRILSFFGIDQTHEIEEVA